MPADYLAFQSGIVRTCVSTAPISRSTTLDGTPCPRRSDGTPDGTSLFGRGGKSMTASRPPGFSAAARLLTMTVGLRQVMVRVANQDCVAAERRKVRAVHRAFDDDDVREPFALLHHRAAPPAASRRCRSSKRGPTDRRPWRTASSRRRTRRPRRRPSSPGFRSNSLTSSGTSRLGSLDLPLGQTRLLRSEMRDQQKNETDWSKNTSHNRSCPHEYSRHAPGHRQSRRHESPNFPSHGKSRINARHRC